MEIPKLMILLCYICHSFASEHSHTIPVENYETELQDLGSHVESHSPPAKVIKITKTIAVKIPVPYPVKVIEKVPYPVHIAKPYPVPVPQIVHVPKHDDSQQAKPHQEHAAHDEPQGYLHHQSQHSQQEESPEGHFQVQEAISSPYNDNSEYSPNFGSNDHGHSAEAPGGNYNLPNSYNGYSDDSGSYESKNYNQAINQYLKHHPGSSGSSNNFHYH